MDFSQFLSLIKLFAGKGDDSFSGIIQIVLFIAVFFVGNYLTKKLPKIIEKKEKKEKLPSTDLNKILNGKGPWEISVSCNFDEICLCQDEKQLISQMLEIINEQRKSEIPRITFNLMRIGNVNTSFCDAFKNVILKVLAENNIFVQVVFSKKGPEKLLSLYKSLYNLVEASAKTNILIRYGDRNGDDK